MSSGDSTIARARGLRASSTKAESLLWAKLRNRQLAGAKFVRQEPIGPYVVDFVCRKQKLVIEVDGGQHAQSAHDAGRDAFLRARGFRVMRFWNNEVLGNLEGVWLVIDSALAERSSHPDPLPACGEREACMAASEPGDVRIHN
jgi:very-short-patch-repair endonuclease